MTTAYFHFNFNFKWPWNVELDTSIYYFQFQVAMDNTKGGWHVELDTSTLLIGMVYRMCLDFDAQVSEKHYDDIFVRIYVISAVSAITFGINSAADQTIRIRCQSCVHNVTTIYLASVTTDCDNSITNGYK